MGNKSIDHALQPMYRNNDSANKPTMLSIITAKHCAKIRVSDIEMLEQEGRVLHIVTVNKEYVVYENIRNVAGMLRGRSFYCPLRHFVINFDHVNSIDDMYVYFESGATITMGRNSIGRTKEAFRKYMREPSPYTLDESHSMVAEDHENKEVEGSKIYQKN